MLYECCIIKSMIFVVSVLSFILSIVIACWIFPSDLKKNIVIPIAFATILYAVQIFTFGLLQGRGCAGSACGWEMVGVSYLLIISTPVVLVINIFLFKYLNRNAQGDGSLTTQKREKVLGVMYIIALAGVIQFSVTLPEEQRLANDGYETLLNTASEFPLSAKETILAEIDRDDISGLTSGLVEVIKKDEILFFLSMNSAETKLYSESGVLYKACDIPYKNSYQAPSIVKSIVTDNGLRVVVAKEVDMSGATVDVPVVLVIDPFTCELDFEHKFSKKIGGFSGIRDSFKLEYIENILSVTVYDENDDTSCTQDLTISDGPIGLCEPFAEDSDNVSTRKVESLVNGIYYQYGTSRKIDYDGDGEKEIMYGILPYSQSGGWLPHQVLYVVTEKEGDSILGVYRAEDGPRIVSIADLDGDGREGVILIRTTLIEQGYPQKKELLYVEFE